MLLEPLALLAVLEVACRPPASSSSSSADWQAWGGGGATDVELTGLLVHARLQDEKIRRTVKSQYNESQYNDKSQYNNSFAAYQFFM